MLMLQVESVEIDEQGHAAEATRDDDDASTPVIDTTSSVIRVVHQRVQHHTRDAVDAEAVVQRRASASVTAGPSF